MRKSLEEMAMEMAKIAIIVRNASQALVAVLPVNLLVLNETLARECSSFL